MTRVCKRKDGSVFIDLSGRSPGRGCYLCREGGCAEDPRLGERISRGLRRTVPPGVISDLAAKRY